MQTANFSLRGSERRGLVQELLEIPGRSALPTGQETRSNTEIRKVGSFHRAWHETGENLVFSFRPRRSGVIRHPRALTGPR
jgi:hypothetical protein